MTLKLPPRTKAALLQSLGELCLPLGVLPATAQLMGLHMIPPLLFTPLWLEVLQMGAGSQPHC